MLHEDGTIDPRESQELEQCHEGCYQRSDLSNIAIEITDILLSHCVAAAVPVMCTYCKRDVHK
jgi:hypothetical protein